MSKFSTKSGWLVCSNTADIVHLQKVNVGGEEGILLLNNIVDIVRDSLPTPPLLNSTDRSSPPPVSPPPASPPPVRTPSPSPRRVVTPEPAYPPHRVSIRIRQRKLTPPPPPLQLSVSRNRRATDVFGLSTTQTPRLTSSICESSSPSSPSSSSLPYKRLPYKRFPLVQSTAPLPQIVDVHVTSSQREPSSPPPPTGQLLSTNMTRANKFTILPTIVERRSSCSSLDLTKQSTLDQTQTHFCSSNSTIWIWIYRIVSTVVVVMLAIFVHVSNLAGYDTSTPIN